MTFHNHLTRRTRQQSTPDVLRESLDGTANEICALKRATAHLHVAAWRGHTARFDWLITRYDGEMDRLMRVYTALVEAYNESQAFWGA